MVASLSLMPLLRWVSTFLERAWGMGMAQGLLQLSLDLHYTEDEIYELSLAREPRGSLSAVSTETSNSKRFFHSCITLTFKLYMVVA